MTFTCNIVHFHSGAYDSERQCLIVQYSFSKFLFFNIHKLILTCEENHSIFPSYFSLIKKPLVRVTKIFKAVIHQSGQCKDK